MKLDITEDICHNNNKSIVAVTYGFMNYSVAAMRA